MTPADIVAEALAAGEQRCEAHVSNYAGSPFVPQTMHSHGIRYHRADVFDAALTHLAERLTEAEGRAERAKARAIEVIVEVLDIVNRHDHCADARRAIDAVVSRVEQEDAEAPRG